ncbi:hypothetical protein DICVIV_04726 [Dictyocaulus viviparus]|uniref:Uncharacterized protein n=1 Tax=Dictyocaulus viviparus TaxID=29172 RepID=A0A0D8XZ76_DICVI|nr:hypothetical protein DICVIV_04726 [Dictyocaulus viviparus]
MLAYTRQTDIVRLPSDINKPFKHNSSEKTPDTPADDCAVLKKDKNSKADTHQDNLRPLARTQSGELQCLQMCKKEPWIESPRLSAEEDRSPKVSSNEWWSNKKWRQLQVESTQIERDCINMTKDANVKKCWKNGEIHDEATQIDSDHPRQIAEFHDIEIAKKNE